MSSIHYFKSTPNRDSLLSEKELQNPIYGEDKPTFNMYAVPSKQQNERSPADHEFDNPAYGID